MLVDNVTFLLPEEASSVTPYSVPRLDIMNRQHPGAIREAISI